MTGADHRIVIVGDSIAGCTAARELRRLAHTGPITMVGADPDGCYARPPLSKHVLEPGQGQSDSWDMSNLDITMIATPAVGVDAEERVVITAKGTTHPVRRPDRLYRSCCPPHRRTGSNL